jgi:GNAT superfamily N-acetyltransferase
MAFDYSLEYRGRGAWVDEFYVRRSHRGSGIGTKALEFFCRQARELGVAVVHLEVNHGNPAIELYRRLGFEDHQRYLMTKWIIEKP